MSAPTNNAPFGLLKWEQDYISHYQIKAILKVQFSEFIIQLIRTLQLEKYLLVTTPCLGNGLTLMLYYGERIQLFFQK